MKSNQETLFNCNIYIERAQEVVLLTIQHFYNLYEMSFKSFR